MSIHYLVGIILPKSSMVARKVSLFTKDTWYSGKSVYRVKLTYVSSAVFNPAPQTVTHSKFPIDL